MIWTLLIYPVAVVMAVGWFVYWFHPKGIKMQDRLDLEWLFISSRVRYSPQHGGWDGWVRVGRHEATPGSTSTTDVQNLPPVEDEG